MDAVVIRIDRLDDRYAPPLAAPRAASDLGQQLERPLGRAEVGQAEPHVRRDDADECHAREVVALGDHLRADEHVELVRAERPGRASPPRASSSCRDRRGPPAPRETAAALRLPLARFRSRSAPDTALRISRTSVGTRSE